MTSEKEQKILREAQDRLKRAMEEDDENRKAALNDLEFVAVEGAQWPADIRAARETDGRPCITTNKMPTYIDQVVGDQRMNRPSIKVIPVDSKADIGVARILGGWIKHVQQISKSDIAIDHGFEHAATCGYGALRVITKYISDSAFEQEAYIEKIDNALAVYWGRHSNYDCSDAQYCFIISDIDKAEYKEKYGFEPMPFNVTDSQYVDGWVTKNTVRLAEYFVKESVEKKLYLLVDGRTVDELSTGDISTDERKVLSYKVMWYLLSGNKILDSKEWVGKKYIPVIPIWGKEFNVGGRRIIRGLIRNAKDPQRMFNYWNALSLKTPIPSEYGWILMENVEIGDRLFDEKGKFCSVTNLSPVYENRECLEVCFDDGTKIVADVEHLWAVEERGKRTSKTFTWENKTVTTKQLVPGRHFIYVAEPLDLSRKTFPIPPYGLGVWLGDGSSSEPNFTQGLKDAGEMSAYLETAGCIVGPVKVNTIAGVVDRSAVNRTLLGLRSKFVELNLLFNKHIPNMYLRGSVEQRLELLQGLMDTDGSVCRHTGACSFTTTDVKIAVGFSELARTLGIKAVFCRRDRRGNSESKIRGKDITHKKVEYQFSFTTRLPVFKLTRKLAGLGLVNEEVRRTRRYKIKSVTPVTSELVRCITVDSPSSLYLAGLGMIPTHNSVDTEVVALQPKIPFLVTPKQIAGHEAQWNESHRRNFPYLLTNFDEKAPGWPSRQTPPQASSAMAERLQATDQEMRDTIGLQRASMGMQSNERSGVAIRERKMEGDVGTFAFIDNLSRSVEHIGRVLVDIAPGLLDTERIIRLGLDNGEYEFAEVNKEVKSEEGISKVINDLSVGTYDIVVTVGPSFTTQRTEARQSMAEFIQYYPAAAPLIGDLYSKAMDWPGAEEVSERLEFLLPPEIKAKKAEEAAKKAGGAAPPPAATPPAPPPDPRIEQDMQKGQIDLQVAQVKLEQEKVKLEGLKQENVQNGLEFKDKVKQAIDQLIAESKQGEAPSDGGSVGVPIASLPPMPSPKPVTAVPSISTISRPPIPVTPIRPGVVGPQAGPQAGPAPDGSIAAVVADMPPRIDGQ
jgi:hypothetical protein